MINFLLEKVIRCTQMYVDYLRASKLVTLGYRFELQHFATGELRDVDGYFRVHRLHMLLY